MIHRYELKVRGFHLDLYGHVNNARYLEFLEEARWDLVESKVDLAAWHERGLGFVVINIDISYRLPATLGDRLEIRSYMKRIGGRSGVVHQDVVRAGTSEAVVTADVTFVVSDLVRRKAMPMEGEVREIFADFLFDAEQPANPD